MRRFLKILAIAIAVILISLIAINQRFHLYAFNPYSVCMTQTLCVMTWNIHVLDSDFDAKQEGIAEAILKERADVVLVNEFYQERAARLDSLLRKEYPYVVDKYGLEEDGHIFYSRYPIEKEQKMTSVPFYSHVYEYRLKVEEQMVRIVGCHLHSNNYGGDGLKYKPKRNNKLLDLPNYYANYKVTENLRAQQTQMICDSLAAEELPTIVMGDMNDFPGTAPLTILQDAGLKDGWWERGTGFGFTFHQNWMHFRLDHILYDKHWSEVCIKVGESELSDHKPLVAVFRRN